MDPEKRGMLPNESLYLYKKLQKQICQKDILIISNICKTLCLPQKTLSISYYNFFAAKAECKIEPDDVVLVTSAIDLACKLCETIRSVEKILKLTAGMYAIEIEKDLVSMYVNSINITEVEISIVLDFNFGIADIYTKLEKICKERKLDSIISRRCWIFLNDIMETPLSLYYTIEEILSCTIFINFVIEEAKKSDELNDEDIYNAFVKAYGFTNLTFECTSSLCIEVLNIYSLSD
ncbi:hypothetical protein GINT2_000066 [Glugoides intestinalis]